jgi:hypothetical protein
VTPLGRRFAGVLARLGETVLIAGVNRTAVVAMLRGAQAAELVASETLDTLPRPWWGVYLPADAPVSVGQGASLRSQTVQVRAVQTLYVGGGALCRLAVMA